MGYTMWKIFVNIIVVLCALGCAGLVARAVIVNIIGRFCCDDQNRESDVDDGRRWIDEQNLEKDIECDGPCPAQISTRGMSWANRQRAAPSAASKAVEKGSSILIMLASGYFEVLNFV